MSGPLHVAMLAGPLELSPCHVAGMDIAGALVAAGVRVTVLGGPGPLAQRFEASGATVRVFDLSGRLAEDLPRLPELRRAVLDAGADLIHVLVSPLARHGALLARITRRPWVLTVTDPARAPRVDRAGLLRRLLAPSVAVRDELVLSLGVPRDRVEAIPPGVDLRRFPEPSTPLSGPAHILGVLTVLDRTSGLPGQLEATRLLLAGGASIHLLVVGRGHEEEPIRRLAREMGIQKHVTVSDVSRDFERVLDTVDLFAFPRTQAWTAFGILQAMAAGRPVVAAGTGAVYSLVREGETGLMAPPADPAALAERIGSLLANPNRARAMGRAGRAAAESSFGMTATSDRLLAVYTEALGGVV